MRLTQPQIHALRRLARFADAREGRGLPSVTIHPRTLHRLRGQGLITIARGKAWITAAGCQALEDADRPPPIQAHCLECGRPTPHIHTQPARDVWRSACLSCAAVWAYRNHRSNPA